jgi:hypothetical protein
MKSFSIHFLWGYKNDPNTKSIIINKDFLSLQIQNVNFISVFKET